MISMILKKSAKRVEKEKTMTMLENNPEERMDKEPSPRVLNTHFPPRYVESLKCPYTS